MKKLILLLAFVSISLGCDKDDYVSQNPYLPNYNFEIELDLNLPAYSQLNFPSNPVRIFQAGAGINGIIVMKTGSGFTAWEVTCPNQPITECSILEIDGINAVCPCDEVAYSLFNGQGAAQYPLKQYRVDVLTPTFIRVYN
jgi:nitrite reductase/ring-hydroxylating ferredoxin subunit